MADTRVIRFREASIDTLHLVVMSDRDSQEAQGWRPVQEIFGRDKFGPFAELEFVRD